MSRLVAFMLFIGLILLTGGSAHERQSVQVVSIAPTGKDRNNTNDFPVTFVDVASLAGLNEQIIYGGVENKRYIIEANGCGVAFIDYDNDGWEYILVLTRTRLAEFPNGKEPINRLLRNNG